MPNMSLKRLVVVSPGLGLRAVAWQPLVDRLRSESGWGDDTTEYFLHESHTRPLGLKSLDDLGRRLSGRLHAKWVQKQGFDEIVLVGHSVGGLVVRRAFLEARGTNANLPPQYPWADAVRRIVLVAAPNRGIARLRPLHRPVDWILRRIPMAPTFTYQHTLRGSTFVTSLRIGWIRLFLGAPEGADLPDVVQLLGDEDSVVSRDDSIDVMAFPGAAQVPVPAADHDDVHRLDGLPSDVAEERYALLRAAIQEPALLQVSGVSAKRGMDEAPSHVVIILHGIRASGIDKWLLELEKAIREAYPIATVVERPSYGYLTARQFALPFARRRFIDRLQDAYTELRARHPQAQFDFVGHSNGTYMLGRSLLEVPDMTFRNVVLAGAVLPSTYPWDERLEKGQVGRVRSDRGKGDWPVALLCNALRRGLGMRDVGTGGYSGFVKGDVDEEPYHPGGHGGMLSEGNIPRIVSFLRDGSSGPLLTEQGPDGDGFGRLSRAIPWLVRLVLVSALAYGVWLYYGDPTFALVYAAAVAVLLGILYVGLDIV